MKQQLLLLQDVESLGRSGDVVSAKKGYIRNFLLPQKKGVIADAYTLKMQERLKLERENKATEDKKQSEELVQKLEGFTLSIVVKVDPEGHMYGSVSALDIAKLTQEKGYSIEKKNVDLPQPIKKIGSHKIPLKLKEGITGEISLEIVSESGALALQEEPKNE